MPKSIRDIPKKKGRGRPKTTGRGQGVLVRLHDPELSALDQWREDQDPVPTRPEAIRYALRDWLIGMGILPISSKKTGD